MTNKKGFTLTEVLLAILIVAVIGVALASLTTTASRESGIGKSRVVIRNMMGQFVRQLRQDIQESSMVLYVRGPISSVGTEAIPLLALAKNSNLAMEQVGDRDVVQSVIYCLYPGSTTTLSNGSAVVPAGSTIGGEIRRYEIFGGAYFVDIDGNPTCGGEVVLKDVKFIPSANYYAPYIGLVADADATYNYYDPGHGARESTPVNSRLKLNVIVELPGAPAVNDVTEEIFMLPNGFADSR